MTDIRVKLREDAEKIYTGAISACLPDAAVLEAMKEFRPPCGRIILVAIGKAAFRMAKCAAESVKKMGLSIFSGVVITKYGHAEGKIEGVEIYEAGHPIPDENGVRATERALSVTENLTEDDTVLFLVSGGGSALFESPCAPLSELSELTRALLASGADINEINAVRKHASKVKGGRFAEHVSPAGIFAVVLSDVLGNRLDTIASGPAAPDKSTSFEALEIIRRYNINISDAMRAALSTETPKEVKNVFHVIAGSVSELCICAKREAEALGYKTEIITDSESGIASELGARLAKLALEKSDTDIPLAFIVGGETVVKLNGTGIGGRNQETALAAAPLIAGLENVLVFSVGSDGTDGPTDAAGGMVTGESYGKMLAAGINSLRALDNNDSNTALSAIGGLIVTGPTGTNVNDVAAVLIAPTQHVEGDVTRRFSNLERVLNYGLKYK